MKFGILVKKDPVANAPGTDLTRLEGVRVKHRAEQNSIKTYDKQGSVLRIETTINNARRFKVFRQAEGKTAFYWRPMPKGVVETTAVKFRHSNIALPAA